MFGIRIIENPHLTKLEQQTVPRSTRERWLSWPWRPWQKTKVIMAIVPDTESVYVTSGFIVCHPAAADLVRARVAEANPVFSERVDPWRH